MRIRQSSFTAARQAYPMGRSIQGTYRVQEALVTFSPEEQPPRVRLLRTFSQ